MAYVTSEHILIVEDDPIQCETLRAALEYGGYSCEAATTGAAALNCLKNHNPDAILVDLGLPDCNGIELISAVRRSSDIPLIVVSGYCMESDKIAALDSGADDYVEKPYLPGELVARLRAKLRQYRNNREELPDTSYAPSPDAELYLSRMERALLSFLVQHQGATISEDDIIAFVWGSRGGATSADLRSLVLKLRRKLEEQRQPLFVLNERGVGYYVSGWGRFPRRAISAKDHRDAGQPADHRSARGTVQPTADRSNTVAAFPLPDRLQRDRA